MSSSLGSYARRSIQSSAGLSKHAMNIAGTAASIGSELVMGKKSLGKAILGGTAMAAMGTTIPGFMGTTIVAGGARVLTKGYLDHKAFGHQKWEKNYNSNFGGSFKDSDQAYTMRQRSLSAMSQSRSNARSILGSEARSLHR